MTGLWREAGWAQVKRFTGKKKSYKAGKILFFFCFFLYFYNQCFQRLSNFVKNCFVKYFFFTSPQTENLFVWLYWKLDCHYEYGSGGFQIWNPLWKIVFKLGKIFFYISQPWQKACLFFFFLKKNKTFLYIPCVWPPDFRTLWKRFTSNPFPNS